VPEKKRWHEHCTRAIWVITIQLPRRMVWRQNRRGIMPSGIVRHDESPEQVWMNLRTGKDDFNGKTGHAIQRQGER
jgi:hypothetical protein